MKKNAFYYEDIRKKLAKKNDLKKLKSFYSARIPEITNFNTSSMWGEINQHGITQKENPMAWDRVHRSAKLISGKGRVLDIGFGSGIIEEILSKSNRQFELYGIDIAKKSVLAARKKFPNGFFQVGSILKLPYDREKFNYVLALEVLEHIQPHDTFTALGEIYKVLKPGGCFIISVPLNEGLERLIKENRNLNAHVREYTPELIKAELKIAGFTVLNEDYLYAFHRAYKIKSAIAPLFKDRFLPNNIIILCSKN